jgi:hypothetical protein
MSDAGGSYLFDVEVILSPQELEEVTQFLSI